MSGNFTVVAAKQLAVQLRAGALPAKLAVVEERVVPAGRQRQRASWRRRLGGFDRRGASP